MASKYAMETVFQLIDKVSRPLDKIGIKSKTVTKKLQKDFAAAQKRLDNLGKSIAKWGKRAALAVAAAAAAWVGMGVKNALTLADTMAKIGHAANITGPPLEQIRQNLTRVANEAGFAVNELASIASTAISSGIAAESSADFAAIVMKTAKITGSASDQIVNGLTTVINAYGFSGDEAARVSGMMISANRLGKTSFEEMTAGMKSVIPAAAALGVQTEHVFAGITALTSKGLTTKDAMKTLGDSFSAIKRPSKDAAALAQRLGIDFSEAALRSKGFAGFMEDLRQKTGGNTRILETLFGNEKIARSMSILTTTGADAFSSALAEMTDSLNTVDEEFARVTDTPAERWKKAVNKIQNAGVSLGTTILPVVERVIGKVTEIADRLSSVDFSQYSGTIDMVFSKIEWLVGGIVGLVKMAWSLRYVIGAVVGVLAIYHGALMVAALYTKTFAVWQGVQKTVMFAVTLATKGQAAALGLLKAGTIAYNIVSKAFAIGAKIAAAAQWALNAAMMANPIGLIIAAIVALIAIVIICVKNWDKITDALKRAWEWFKNIAIMIKNGVVNAFKNLGAAIKENQEKVMGLIAIFTGPFGFIISMVKELFNNWSRVTDAFKEGGILAAIKKIGAVLLSGVLAPIQGLLEILSYIPGLGHLAGKGAEKIAEFRNSLLGEGSDITAKIKMDKIEPPVVEPPAPPDMPATRAVEPPPVQVNVPEVDYPDMGTAGAGGAATENKLHGVVDVSGGARAPVIPNLSDGGAPGTYTVNQAVSTPSISVQDAIGTAASGVTNVLREILASTKAIETRMIDENYLRELIASTKVIETTTAHALAALEAPATITLTVPSIPPQAARSPYTGHTAPQRRVNTGRSERERADREDPRNIAPVTREDRMAYSLRENRETLGIEVAAAQGTEARIVRRPRSPNIHIINSGGNA